MARAAGFDLVGLARAEPIPPEVLGDWLAQGYHADLDWMAERVAERLDVTKLLPGARTVVSLACNYWHGDESGPIARYARGRDYHATMRDRLRTLRRSLREAFPGVDDYGAVDANPVMEKVWAVRAGLGTVGKNACLITKDFGSWVVLATMILTAEADGYDDEAPGDVCGRCTLCLTSCPTSALVADRVVDAGLCLSYQTIENEQPVPETLRRAMPNLVFGCDVCQDVCPLNATPVRAGSRFQPRAVAQATVAELAAMTRAQFDGWAKGMALMRAGYDGLRRNAAYALGAMRAVEARPVLEQLTSDAAPGVREAATWALEQLP
ncbi:MAG: tRNA epoxyqueuosine(34) reductase QueG [Myxococcaceae bacterium]|jgi:epoxyqueuosine reductase|nr:tRNA epoxyqueuosine(34) reductase QueG [Myxococcaceae bacterium]